MKVLVTGANGFVGHALCARLNKNGVLVVPGVRRACGMLGEYAVADIHGETSWTYALKGCQAVIHLAARVHVMKDKSPDPLAAFRRVNVKGTANLARQAARAGVHRFVYLSSIKVNGEFTEAAHQFAADDPPAPDDPYGVSKHEAEQLLLQIAAETGMEVTCPVFPYR